MSNMAARPSASPPAVHQLKISSFLSAAFSARPVANAPTGARTMEAARMNDRVRLMWPPPHSQGQSQLVRADLFVERLAADAQASRALGNVALVLVQDRADDLFLDLP